MQVIIYNATPELKNMADLYWLGVLLSIGSGILNFLGTVMQKKVVNEIPPENREQRFFRALVRKPLWIWGLLCQLAFGSILFMLAQDIIGPTLPPGLMATGLIVLAIGSVKIIHESLHRTEIIGIALMIVAILFLGMSDLQTPVTKAILLDPGFLVRVTIFTVICLGIIIGCQLIQKKVERVRGILLTIASGTFFALSNFWIAPLMGTIDRVLGGLGEPLEIILFVIACVFLIMTNIFGLTMLQTAFKYGQASNLVSIQQIPTQIAPIFYFFSVFQATPLHDYSTPLLIIAIALILVSTFFLARRQVQLEEIK